MAKLLLWHWLQPAAYFVALAVYWDSLSTLQHWLAGIVAVREAIYLGATVVALFAKPAYLLVDMRATWADTGPRAGWTAVLIYVLSPEKYALMAIFGTEGGRGFNASLVIILFDLAGATAFVTAIKQEEPFPPPLLVGYFVAALAMVTIPLAMNCATCRPCGAMRC